LPKISAYEYMREAFTVLTTERVPRIDEYKKPSAIYGLTILGYGAAAAAVERMTYEEYLAWIENDELAPWMNSFFNIGESDETYTPQKMCIKSM